MDELLVFYGLLGVFVLGGLAYSLRVYHKSTHKHEDRHTPGAHA